MVLPPALNLTFGIAVIAPLVIGLLVGIIIKSAIKIGIAIAVLLLILIGLGILTPDQILKPILSAVQSGSALTEKVKQVAGYLPYSSLAFLIGLAIGFLKG